MKIHISKQIDTLNTFCGKNMSFGFNLLTETGEEYGNTLYLKSEDIKTKKLICKICLLRYEKTN